MTAPDSLTSLTKGEGFARRHIGPAKAERDAMLRALGYDSLPQLIDAALPPAIRSQRPLALPPALTEAEALARLAEMAAANRPSVSLIGMGYHDCHMPPVIQRNLFENPAWYTAYTPYQSEVSQGRLEALITFQQMVMDLTGMELANASLLDEATAAAEAMTLCRRMSRSKASAVFLAEDLHPQTKAVIETRAAPLGIEVVVGDPEEPLEEGACFAVILQYPGSDGRLRDPKPIIEAAHAAGALVAVATDLLACTLLTPPGELGADVVFGSAQRFGVPLGYGGPHAAFMACRDSYKRQMPGRIIGVSHDRHGGPALRMAMQTREQHIRREKATSNICTAQVLLANIAGMYAVWHGPEGLTTVAKRVHRAAAVLAAGLRQLGYRLKHDSYFDTLAVETAEAAELHAAAAADGIDLRLIGADCLGIALDETVTPLVLERLLALFAKGGRYPAVLELDAAAEPALPAAQRRQSAFLSHAVFHLYRSETEMMRYLRRLAAKDVALDRSMIPLGSCTMKLNAAAEMMAVSWPGFGGLHPFAPLSRTEGYRRLFHDLEAWIAEMTGFAGVSLQPNAGSQGEYSGLLAIRRYHESRDEAHRDVCLIPDSAHGTNPASAVLAGMKVVLAPTDDEGNVDPAALEALAAKHAERLAAFMITYPSTHGVFEGAIKDLCATVHRHGGRVYMDGANMNALVGLARPAELGADVMHLNLHKTFCIPHGGGGPGMGPIACTAELAPFLPGHAVVETGHGAAGAVSAAPWGSASILPISWAYIAMMGPALKEASEVAILNANYIAHRLAPHYPLLFTGQNGRSAHECILDLRPFKESAGISNEDVAKRLIDFGFHAPTMSFPVPGTLMIEPTESETKAEIDRFCDAMIAIRKEIAAVEAGDLPADDNPLVMAPHTAAEVMADSWHHPYSRQQAAFPLPWVREDKFWPPVGRVDNVAGDRTLVCACPPLSAYQEAAE